MDNNFNLLELTTIKSATFYLYSNSTIRQALEKFAYHKFSVVPIIDEEGHFVTTLSEGDILRYLAIECDFDKKKAEKTTIMEIERYRSYNAVTLDATFDELYAAALSQNFIPVVDDRNIYIGIIKRKDIFVYLKQKTEKIPR